MRATALLALSALLLAQGAAAPVSGATPTRDPAALAALDRMGSALQHLRAFTFVAEVNEDEVLTTGQKLQTSSQVTASVRAPDRFRVESLSDRRARAFYYDGKAVTVFAPRLGYYASFTVPPTIGAALRRGEERYGLTVPLEDLLAWTDPARISSAAMEGGDTINGQSCDHLALRQPDLDWQVWIARTGPALPCKLVITTTGDPAMPQFSAVLHWETNPGLSDAAFTFAPPPDARKIAMAQLPFRSGK